MKKTIQLSLLFIVASITAFITPLKAQNATKELAGFTKKFQAAYNSKDDEALKTMYTDDAVRTAADGASLTGKDAIVGNFKNFFTENKVALELKQTKVEAQADGSAVAVGTYHLMGSSKTGEKIDRTGTYTNTVVKQKGHWKIAKTILAGN